MQFEYDPEKLIEEVKKRPGIWDFVDIDYRSKNVRFQLWNEVVRELLDSNIKVSKTEMRELEIQLQKKWKSIRDCFQKYIQNPHRSRKPYIYSKQLQFLLKNQLVDNDGSSESDAPAKKYRQIWKSKRTLKLRKEQESSDEEIDTNTNDAKQNDSDNDETNDYSNDDVEIAIPAKVQKTSKPSPPRNEFAFACVDSQIRSDSDDPDRLFLLSLLPHLKSIPDEMRINVKMDLMSVLKNANFGVNRDKKIF